MSQSDYQYTQYSSAVDTGYRYSFGSVRQNR